jgi:hypothetical protein
MVQKVQIDKGTYQLLVGILTALGTFLPVLIQTSIQNTTLAVATGLFVGTAITQIIMWLRYEEQQAPGPPPPESS